MVDKDIKLILRIPSDINKTLTSHLLPLNGELEEAAFIFASIIKNNNVLEFIYKDWMPVTPSDFSVQLPYYFELSDKMRQKIIKTAHDLNCCIVEFHSHIGQFPACFSSSDWNGFNEFVPHILWRLKNKFYIAVIVTNEGFDALVWINKSNNVKYLDEIRLNNRSLLPTCLSLERIGLYGE